MRKNPNAPPPKFRWFRAAGHAANAGTWAGGAAAGTAAATGAGPAAIATAAAIAFVGAAGSSFSGEVMKHRLDDPSPVFDEPTILLFDIVGYVVGFMLFVVPALQLDHALYPNAPLPGWFGFAAIFLTAFLLPVLRGLLINLGLARADEEEITQR